MNIEFLGTDDNHQDETSNHWWRVDGQDWAISERLGEIQLLDCDGFPVEDRNDHGGIKDLLMPFYNKLFYK